jgi:Flp pilus assembly protein TadD
MAPVICRHCGGKSKAGRQRCPRCGEILEAAVPAVEATAGQRAALRSYRGPVILICSVLSVALIASIAASRRAPAPGPTAPVAVRPAAAPVATAAPAQPDSGFLDPKTGGSVAYAAGDYSSSLEHYKEAVRLNPNDGDSLNNLGQLLSRNGDPTAAIPYLRKAVELYPSVWAYRFNLAHAHGRLENWSQAVDDYRQARNLFPDDYATSFNLGMALHKLGDEEAAVHEFRRGAELAPAEPSFQFSLGISYERLDRVDEAVKAYEAYLALAPSAPDADTVKARIELLRKPVQP